MSAALVVLALCPAAAPHVQPAWVVEVGLTAGQLKSRTDALGRRGFRPVRVCGYNCVEVNRYAAIWAKVGGGEWRMDYGLRRKDFVSRAEDLKDRGFRLVSLSGYDLIGSERFADVWVKDRGPAWEWVAGVDAGGLAKALAGMKQRGVRPVRVSSYFAGVNAYALLGEKGGGAWELKWGMTPGQLQSALDDLGGRGYRPVSISALASGTGARYAAVWHKKGGPAWEVKYGQDQDSFVATARAMAAAGYRPVCVAGYNTLDGDRYASIWERD